MALNVLPTEIILNQPCETLTHLYLDWEPQPGAYLDLEGQTYLVLERRHRYRLASGQYRLYQVALYVQKSQAPVERSLWDGHWVLGDATCQFNTRSPLLRCAVNPSGPCDRCLHYQPLASPS
ncbi:MAG: DUF6464 family protein [Thermosynechococcaceae cyanobacterium]